MAQERRSAGRPTQDPSPVASGPLCPACGASLRPERCKLFCTRPCGYFESCSDLLPPLEAP